MAATWTVVAETREWVGPIAVTKDDEPFTDFEISVQPRGARPDIDTFGPPSVLDGAQGVLVGTGSPWPLRPGVTYTIYVRVSDTPPEAPVMIAGFVKAT